MSCHKYFWPEIYSLCKFEQTWCRHFAQASTLKPQRKQQHKYREKFLNNFWAQEISKRILQLKT